MSEEAEYRAILLEAVVGISMLAMRSTHETTVHGCGEILEAIQKRLTALKEPK